MTEPQTWLEFAVKCHYLPLDIGESLTQTYDRILAMLITMIRNPKKWLLPKP